MRYSVLVASLFLACNGLAAKSSPSQMRVVGEWSGRGETAGHGFTACAEIAPYMDDVYLRLDYRVAYDSGTPMTAQQTESFYVFLNDNRVEGVTLDNASNVFQIHGRVTDQSMNTQWFKNGRVVGKSEWQLSQDGKTLHFTRFGLFPDGELKEIGGVKMTRLPNGKHCGK